MAKKLEPYAYQFFGCKEIQPRGWLLNQLQIQARGLSGKLDQFWPDIKDSQWIGGRAEGWERVPYWLDGFIPLAFLLDDEDMKRRAGRYIDEIILRQDKDGWICPAGQTDRSRYDMWALFLILKVLVVWHDATGDERIENVVQKALRSLDLHIDVHLLFDWAQTRWFEALIPIFWLYDRTRGQWLLDLAVKLRAQGFDWVAFFEEWPMEKPLAYGRWSQMNHVVNQAMILKSGALYARLSGQERDRSAAADMLEKLDLWHGSVTGMFTGDECLAGLSPIQGTELCAVVEMMYSLEWLLALTGNPSWGDRLERVAFNALPATFSPDMEWHQYVQQVNQIECSAQENPLFLTNGPEANLFGVEPNFGCCTANLSQGWPKLALSAFMRDPAGIAIMMLLPASLETEVNGVPVRISIQTGYPFRNTARISLTSQQPAPFTLKLRIPGWAANPTVKLDGRIQNAKAGCFIEMTEEWLSNTIDVELPMPVSLLTRPNDLHAVLRGPLVYAIPIKEKWIRQNKAGTEGQPWLNNWELLPASPWAIGLVLDPSHPETNLVFEERDIGGCPFSPEGAPVIAKAKGRSIPWGKARGAAAPAPSGPAEGPVQDIQLIPYGCTNLRMTEIPFANV
jgi:uncharacterized protein